MTFEEAIESTVTKAQALAEIRRHGCSVEEFILEQGDHPTYAGEDVLGWLGY